MPPTFFDAEAGLLEAEVFSSPDIYRDEIRRVFSRAWLMVAPTAWLTTPGAFVSSYLGETPVFAWRDEAGAIEVFHNRCVASNDLLVSTDRGETNEIVCSCHGWTYDGAHPPEVVSRVEVFDGLVFACSDPDAPPLVEAMGDFAWCWSLIARQLPGGLEVYGDRPLRTRMRCNWKLAAEAYAGDVYSDQTLTRATREVTDGGPALTEREGFQIAAGSGAMSVLTDRPNAESGAGGYEGMTPLMATMFPNLSYDGRGPALHVWHPKGPGETEVHTYCLAGRSEPAADKESRRRRTQFLFGPAGLMTEDQGAVWASITRTSRKRAAKLNLQMGLGRERRSNLPGMVSDLASEMNQRAFYGWWQARLAEPAPEALGGKLRLAPMAPLNQDPTKGR